MQQYDVPISRLELSATAYNALRLNGLHNLSDVAAFDLENLRELRALQRRYSPV